MTSTDDTSFKGSNKKYLARKYNYLKDPKDRNWVTCLFCENETKRGIFRAKKHQMRKRKKNVVRFLKASDEVRKELKKYKTNKMNKKDNYSSCRLMEKKWLIIVVWKVLKKMN